MEVSSLRETDCTVATGAWLIACTRMEKTCATEVSPPPCSLPPLSLSRTVIVAEPMALVAGVNERVPFGVIAGCAENNAERSLLTRNTTAWVASLAGPGLMRVAQFGAL